MQILCSQTLLPRDICSVQVWKCKVFLSFLRFGIGSEPLQILLKLFVLVATFPLVDSSSQALLSELLGKYKDATFQRSLREANDP